MGGNHLELDLQEKTPFFTRIRRVFEANSYKLLLRFYIFGTILIKIPFMGKRLKKIIEWYGASQHGGRVISRNEAFYWVERAESILASICYCRDTFKNCRNSTNICLRLSDVEIFKAVNGKRANLISKEKAKEIIEKSEKNGLFHAIVWCGHPNVYAICNCCTCCCVPYRLWEKYDLDSALGKGNLVAMKIGDLCTNCSKCLETCKFNAVEIIKDEIGFNIEKCFGCGLCANSCENKAVELRKIAI